MDFGSIISGAVGAAVIGGVFTIAQILLNKRLRTPSDRLAEAQFSVKVYQDQLAEARADKALNDDTIKTLREYAAKVEGDGREDQKLIIDLYRQIQALEQANHRKDEKIIQLRNLIDSIAQKVARGEAVTLADLGADPSPLGDMENTQTHA